ncbi:MAG: hypothetical protein IM638_17335 [Bacteroidetes bacterium]|nr:hypothetical protein [Bacteroidota bacterium]
MKTVVTIFMLALGTLLHAQASPYEVGTNVVSLGVGVGSSWGFNSARQTPAFNLQYERGIAQLGPGVLSLGGYLGYKGFSYRYNYPNGFYYEQNWRYTIFGVRAAWHLQELDGLNLEKWDLYGGIMIGFNNVGYTYKDNDPAFDYSSNNYGSSVGWSSFLGARYFLSEKFALQGELGYGISYLSVGLAYKF